MAQECFRLTDVFEQHCNDLPVVEPFEDPVKRGVEDSTGHTPDEYTLGDQKPIIPYRDFIEAFSADFKGLGTRIDYLEFELTDLIDSVFDATQTYSYSDNLAIDELLMLKSEVLHYQFEADQRLENQVLDDYLPRMNAVSDRVFEIAQEEGVDETINMEGRHDDFMQNRQNAIDLLSDNIGSKASQIREMADQVNARVEKPQNVSYSPEKAAETVRNNAFDM